MGRDLDALIGLAPEYDSLIPLHAAHTLRHSLKSAVSQTPEHFCSESPRKRERH